MLFKRGELYWNVNWNGHRNVNMRRGTFLKAFGRMPDAKYNVNWNVNENVNWNVHEHLNLNESVCLRMSEMNMYMQSEG